MPISSIEPLSSKVVPPFVEREYVNVTRCAHILGVSGSTVYRLAATSGFDGNPLLSIIDYRRGAWKRVLYSSIVHFCDRLRQKYSIADRRPPLPNGFFRHRDEYLLPFPLADTIYSAEALRALGYNGIHALTRLIEEGHFDAYCLIPGNAWRISRTSFAAYLESVRNKPSTAVQPYRRVPRPRRSLLESK